MKSETRNEEQILSLRRCLCAPSIRWHVENQCDTHFCIVHPLVGLSNILALLFPMNALCLSILFSLHSFFTTLNSSLLSLGWFSSSSFSYFRSLFRSLLLFCFPFSVAYSSPFRWFRFGSRLWFEKYYSCLYFHFIVRAFLHELFLDGIHFVSFI